MAGSKMTVEIWSDFVCPFCYIGETRYEMALKQFEHQGQIETVFRSFELDPGAVSDEGMTTSEMLSKKYGLTMEQVRSSNEQMVQRAADAGLTFHLDDLRVLNTFDAHRLSHYAAEQGKQEELAALLFQAYFDHNRDISDSSVLVEYAVQAGLQEEGAREALGSHRYADEVKRDEAEAVELGVRGVPFFVIDRKYAISGAQDTNVFLETLNKAWQERNAAQ
ncbi:DsbA family oxidoreductase [Paenibacillus sp. HB172176]|uniref:DsbA family oxidoreductase n=1 Tax=Paenibacillus sp. HB172176 TaxID=2493690 RepID=UPI00143C4D48|nr:DsbA family oxidoreductase [Paenibacillus sp. HB172176]